MPDTKRRSYPAQGPRGHPLPRRSTPENSVTLRHHRLARDASTRASPGASAQAADAAEPPTSPRRNSSGNSHDTGNSDPRRWFDQSNRNASARFDTHAMDVDPPFFQKERESPGQYDSKAGSRFDLMPGPTPGLKHAVTHSSSADDYRSVIDDLTVEIQRLKNELKQYKQLGPDELKKEKLFEVKVHGLPKRKKRELEATLRDFAASLHGTPSADTSSSQRDKSNRHGNRLYSASAAMSKHASSSSGSRSRPVDSAYASGSTGPNSSGTSLTRPSFSSRARSSEQKVENYLKDIPEGLYPHHAVMTDKERKKLVVRRLEQLFTGKIGGRNLRTRPAQDPAAPPPIDRPASAAARPTAAAQPPGLAPEATREARILPPYTSKKKKNGSQDRGSTSNSNGDQTESRGNGSGVNISGTNTSPPAAPPPEQRPTRPRDLDPDRIQNPSENMEYIRHLGLVPPGLLPPSETAQHVSPDADGWVYLNLLCNLAQLHIFSVTPDFIRTAVSEKSTKFQLSPDGRKIRWRGGTTGTKFSSDSSGDNSQKTSSNDDSDGSGKGSGRKKRKQQNSGYDGNSASSGKHRSKLGNDASRSSDSFHYKPLFVRQNSSNEQTSFDDTGSSYGPGEDSGVGDSRWGQSGTNSSPQKRRRLDGAIIYYSGAPFCTDLSGDPGDMSPNTYIRSDDQQQQQTLVILGSDTRPLPHRTDSGSSLCFRPLSGNAHLQGGKLMDHDMESPSLDEDDEDEDSDFDADFPWANTQQHLEVRPLEPCGLGGVTPEDNFMVVVTTRRPKMTGRSPRVTRPLRVDESADSIISRLASMATYSPGPRVMPIPIASKPPVVEIDYLTGKIKRLAPATLPPPAVFYPPFSTDESTNSLDMSEPETDSDDISGVEFMSRRANPHQSDNTYPEDAEITSADEEGEDPDDEPPAASSKEDRVLHRKGREALGRRPDPQRLSGASAVRAPPLRRPSKSVEAAGSDSSAATAGGAENEFSSSD